jgi:hypothetical protein
LASWADANIRGETGDSVELGYRLGEESVVLTVMGLVVFIVEKGWTGSRVMSVLVVLAGLISLSNYFCYFYMFPETVDLAV